MRRIKSQGLIALLTTCLAFGACSTQKNDREDNTPGDGDGDTGGKSGDGDGDTGGNAGDGDGDTGGSTGDGDGDGDLGGHSGDGGAGGSGGSDSSVPASGCDRTPDEDDFDFVFDVGPGQPFATPSDVPWENLAPSTLVRIHPQEQPYRDKWVLNAPGTAEQPIIVTGIVEDGRLPVIEGAGAVTRPELDYWNEVRSLIKIGGSSAPANEAASYITLRCLDLRGAHAGSSFTDHQGATQDYADNAAAVHVEEGSNIMIESCSLSASGNGLFSGSTSTDLVIRGNHLLGNGNVDSVYEHNSYTESKGITFEFNHYGALCEGCLGNNLKDRSSGTHIRYNWIENGNRQLDLVDSDHDELTSDTDYLDTYVYGNLLIEAEGEGNRQIIHYGGDGESLDTYRKGTLHLFFNTIVSTRNERTTLVRLSSDDESLAAHHNIIFAQSGGANLELLAEGQGTAVFEQNWISEGWQDSFENGDSGALTVNDNLYEAAPGFIDLAGQDFHLDPGSSCIGAVEESGAPLSVSEQYLRHQGGENRAQSQDIGAYEAPL